MTSKTLILHIGANKTGSSAIQAFLKQNASILPKFGITVATSDVSAGGKVTGEHVWFIQSLLGNIEEGARNISEKIDAVMAKLPDGSKLILSAENLANRNNSHRLFSKMSSKYEIEVILYVRRQDEYLLSSWQQWYGKLSDDFWAWIVSAVGQIGNWHACLEAWETIVPRKKIKVRVYERELLIERDINGDFLELLGLTASKDFFTLPSKVVNPSYSEAVWDFAKGNPLIFDNIHDSGFYNLVHELTGDAFFKKPRESPITLKQRQAIVQRYRASNNWVREAYFPGKTGELFEPPSEKDYEFISREDIEAQKWRLTASLIYGLAKKIAREKDRKK